MAISLEYLNIKTFLKKLNLNESLSVEIETAYSDVAKGKFSKEAQEAFIEFITQKVAEDKKALIEEASKNFFVSKFVKAKILENLNDKSKTPEESRKAVESIFDESKTNNLMSQIMLKTTIKQTGLVSENTSNKKLVSICKAAIAEALNETLVVEAQVEVAASATPVRERKKIRELLEEIKGNFTNAVQKIKHKPRQPREAQQPVAAQQPSETQQPVAAQQQLTDTSEMSSLRRREQAKTNFSNRGENKVIKPSTLSLIELVKNADENIELISEWIYAKRGSMNSDQRKQILEALKDGKKGLTDELDHAFRYNLQRRRVSIANEIIGDAEENESVLNFATGYIKGKADPDKALSIKTEQELNGKISQRLSELPTILGKYVEQTNSGSYANELGRKIDEKEMATIQKTLKIEFGRLLDPNKATDSAEAALEDAKAEKVFEDAFNNYSAIEKLNLLVTYESSCIDRLDKTVVEKMLSNAAPVANRTDLNATLGDFTGNNVGGNDNWFKKICSNLQKIFTGKPPTIK